jgi:hypothetical protein
MLRVEQRQDWEKMFEEQVPEMRIERLRLRRLRRLS